MNRVEKLLKDHGPMLSGDLAREYENEYHTSNEAARKAISRATSPVHKLLKFKFDKNQQFYYLNSQYMSDEYKEMLYSSMKEHSKTNYAYILALADQCGYMTKNILPAFTGAPIGKVKGHKQHANLINALIETGIIKEYDDERYTLDSAFGQSDNLSRAIGLEIAKKAIINDFSKWSCGNNLTAYQSGKTLFECAEFAQFRWAFSAPSYIQPLFSFKDNQPGFVVADVIYGKKATLDSIRFFIEKISIVRSFRNVKPFLPVLLVDKIDLEALQLLKEKKVMVCILNNFFSEKYTDLLDKLVNIFANTTSILNKNPDMIYKLFNELSKSEGRYNDMSGDMFELLVGSHYAHIGCQMLKSKMFISDETGKRRELDLVAEKDGKIIIVECKAYKSKLDEEFVRNWLNDTVPFTRKWFLNNSQNNKMEFQLWSVGGFTENALNLLEKAKESKKYTVSYFNRKDMLKLARETNDNSFVEILNMHFNIHEK